MNTVSYPVMDQIFDPKTDFYLLLLAQWAVMVHRKLKPQEADVDEDEGEKKTKVGGMKGEGMRMWMGGRGGGGICWDETGEDFRTFVHLYMFLFRYTFFAQIHLWTFFETIIK